MPLTSTIPVISVRGVAIGYGERPVVSGIDLAVHAGDVVAVVGPNGSGKSTLVRGILGLAPVLAGEVELFGEPASRSGRRHLIGYVPQRHTVGGAVPSTVAEVVASGRLNQRPWYVRAGAADRAAVTGVIAAVGLADRSRAMVATLSGGQQRRVLIARALAGRPAVLIMDEPTAGVDAQSQRSLVHTLLSLVGSGLTLVIVTHEIAPLRPVLTRLVQMQAGRMVRDERLAPEPHRPGLEMVDDDPAHLNNPAAAHHPAPMTLPEVSRLGDGRTPLVDPTGADRAGRES